jgi:TPR repeat protein
LSRLRDADWQSLPEKLVELLSEGGLANSLIDIQAWAAKGDSAACLAMAHAYYYGDHGVEKNFSEAKHWLEKVDILEDPDGYAAHLLGVISYKGLSLQSDHRKAYKYFRRAALRGSTKGRIMVAVMQRDGDGTLKKPYAARLNFYRCSKSKDLSLLPRWFFAFESWVMK